MAKNTDSASRGNLYGYNPFDVAIAGGKTALKGDEVGPLDTEYAEGDVLCSAAQLVRLQESIGEPFAANIDAYGVNTPITVVKRNGIPFVTWGRSRVRAARRAWKRREKCGEPTLTVNATIFAGSKNDETRLAGAIISENYARRGDDFATTMQLVHEHMGRGVSVEDCAITFNMKLQQLKRWLSFDNDAADAVREAVQAGRISVSAGMEIVSAGGATEQVAALESLSALTVATGGKASTTQARKVAKRAKGEDVLGVTNRRTMRKLLQACLDADRKNASEKTIAFWEGVENALMLILGDADDAGKPEADRRLVDLLAKVEA